MILQALARYYEILADDPESGISRPGYCSARVSFAALLSPKGELLRLSSRKITRQRGKKEEEVPQSMVVPEQVKRAVNIAANFLCENATYFFGLDFKGRPERTKKCFEAFRALHLAVLAGVEAPEARAITAFLSGWDPAGAAGHPALAPYLEELGTGALVVFQLDGGRYAHRAPAIQAAWARWREQGSQAETGQCLVCGETKPIARLHPAIKGVRGAQSTGASIVSFNALAYESYGNVKAQGLNAPVSQYAAFAYTTVLNRLLADGAHRQQLGDATVVYWAECSDPLYQEVFACLENPPLPGAQGEGPVRDEETERMVGQVFKKIAQGRPAREGLTLDPDVHFCVLALSPNASRLSVRFFLRDSFGAFIDRLGCHYRDMQLRHAPFEPDCIPLWRLLAETVPPASKDKAASPLLSGAVLRAILTGGPYPAALYGATFLRVRAERDISYYKVAILKACLLRSCTPTEKEVLTVEPNEQSNNQAYLLGRLFAVLENAQQAAANASQKPSQENQESEQQSTKTTLNTTIKDRYFNSACATPGIVFPTLLKLNAHHIRKMRNSAGGLAYSLEEKISTLVSALPADDPYPARLPIREQGLFTKGYYDQRQLYFIAAEKKRKEKEAAKAGKGDTAQNDGATQADN